MRFDPANIRETAERMIALHGADAAVQALRQWRRLQAAEKDDEAADWERLYKAILHIQRKI